MKSLSIWKPTKYHIFNSSLSALRLKWHFLAHCLLRRRRHPTCLLRRQCNANQNRRRRPSGSQPDKTWDQTKREKNIHRYNVWSRASLLWRDACQSMMTHLLKPKRLSLRYSIATVAVGVKMFCPMNTSRSNPVPRIKHLSPILNTYQTIYEYKDIEQAYRSETSKLNTPFAITNITCYGVSN